MLRAATSESPVDIIIEDLGFAVFDFRCTVRQIFPYISPMICQRSERKVIKTERLNKVITSAMKQSLKAFHPELHQATHFQDLINTDFSGQKFIAYIEDGEHPLLQSLYIAGGDALILIGPEGDFSPEEILQAKEKGFQIVSLGESRLRTETAGVVAVLTVAMMNNE